MVLYSCLWNTLKWCHFLWKTKCIYSWSTILKTHQCYFLYDIGMHTACQAHRYMLTSYIYTWKKLYWCIEPYLLHTHHSRFEKIYNSIINDALHYHTNRINEEETMIATRTWRMTLTSVLEDEDEVLHAKRFRPLSPNDPHLLPVLRERYMEPPSTKFTIFPPTLLPGALEGERLSNTLWL